MGNGGNGGGGGGTGDLGDAFGYAGPGWGDQGGGIGQGGAPTGDQGDAFGYAGPGFGTEGGDTGQGGSTGRGDQGDAFGYAGPGFGTQGDISGDAFGYAGPGFGTQGDAGLSGDQGDLASGWGQADLSGAPVSGQGQAGVPTAALPSNSLSNSSIGKGLAAFAAMFGGPLGALAGGILGAMASQGAFNGPPGNTADMGMGLGDVAGTTGKEGGGINQGKKQERPPAQPKAIEPVVPRPYDTGADERQGRRYTLLTPEGGLQYRPRVRRRTLIGV